MDPLKKQILDAILGNKSGDPKIDEVNENLSGYVIGTIRKYKNDIARIETKKTHFTRAGLDDQKEKAKEKAKQEMVDVFEKASWKKDIAQVQKKFDVIGERNPIEVLVQEGRQRETRQYLREFKDDIGKMAIFQEKILEGDPIAVGAVKNSVFEFIQIDPAVMKIGVEKMRLRTNPAAAQRLETLQKAQDTYESLKGFFNNEIGISGGDSFISSV